MGKPSLGSADQDCPYLDSQWVADTNGQRMTRVAVDLLLVASTLDDGGVSLGDNNLARLAEVLNLSADLLDAAVEARAVANHDPRHRTAMASR